MRSRANGLRLTIRLLLARLIHQVVIDAHAFADAILFDPLLGAERRPRVGVGQQPQRFVLIAFDHGAADVHLLCRSLQLIAQPLSRLVADVRIAAHAVQRALEKLVSAVRIGQHQPIGLANGVVDDVALAA